MKFRAKDIVQTNLVLDALLLILPGFFWAFTNTVDPMVEYPTRPLIQILFALEMLPSLAVLLMWYIRSKLAALLLFGALVSHTTRTYVTISDSQFLSGQSGLMGNLFLAAFMVWSAFFTRFGSPSRKITASLYAVTQALLLHYLGVYLQTGRSAAVSLFQVISLVLAAYYQSLGQDLFDGTFTVDWVKQYTA